MFRCFVRFVSFCKPEFLSWTFWLDLLFEFYLCIWWVLIVCLFVCDRVPGVRRLLLRISRFHGSSARQVTLWSYFSLPCFIALDQSSNNCMIRIWFNMWVWEVVEVERITCFIIKLWELLLRLLCHASRRGLGECFHDRCEIVNLMVYLRWQL